MFTKVKTAYDLLHLSTCGVVCAGTGGSRLFLEYLCRAGVSRFTFIDHDDYSTSNLTTQNCYNDEIGLPKVKCLARLIHRINPEAFVNSIRSRLEEIDDLKFECLLKQSPKIKTWLLLACTDSFPAQARANRLALKFGLPLISSQVYERGLAAELVWMHPDVSRACARCILSSRYAAHAEGPVTPVTSFGAPIYSTLRLNAAEVHLALAILHHGTGHPHWGDLLRRIGTRQLIQLRCHPDADAELGFSNFAQGYAGVTSGHLFSDDAVWRPQLPEHPDTGYPPCPDCGGIGDLNLCRGKFPDTRELDL